MIHMCVYVSYWSDQETSAIVGRRWRCVLKTNTKKPLNIRFSAYVIITRKTELYGRDGFFLREGEKEIFVYLNLITILNM